MRLKKVMLVFRKDWLEISRNWQVILPIVILPFIFSVLLPILVSMVPGSTGTSPENLEEITRNLPSQVKNKLVGMTNQQIMFYITTLYLFAPFFIIIPIMAPSAIASDSFAGEKERRTIEALLATPISDTEMFLGKTLVSFIPTMTVTIASFITYSAIVNLYSTTMFKWEPLLPNLTWLTMIFLLSPTVALASIGLTVMVSAKLKGVREAQQNSAVLLIPIIILVIIQASGAVFIGPSMITALTGIFATIDFLVIYLGVKMFKREEILSKLA